MVNYYDKYREDIKTGDIVLFSGNNNSSRFIRYVTKSKWSNVGMVIKIHDYDVVLLWESTTMNDIPDFYDKVPKYGVMMVPLSERVRAYDGEVYLRRLSNPISYDMVKQLVALRDEVKNRPYEQDKWDMIRSVIDSGSSFENKRDLSSIFCSELVAEALQRIGLITNTIASDEFTPKDFGKGCLVDTLMTGKTYGAELALKA